MKFPRFSFLKCAGNGNSHDPLIRPAEVESLRAWLLKHVPGRALRDTSGMVYEDKLPRIQERLQVRPAAR